MVMTENTENLILEQLKAIRAEQKSARERDKELLRRVTQIENVRRDLAEIISDQVGDRHSVDGLRERVERIERRLELVD